MKRPIQEVSSVELNAWLGAPNFHVSTALWLVSRRNLSKRSHRSLQNPVVIVSTAVLDLLVVGIDSVADPGQLVEVEWCALDMHHLAGWDQRLIDRSDVTRHDLHLRVKDRSALTTTQIPIGVVGEVRNRM